MEIKLRCTRAIVLGGASGIGYAIAKKLADDGVKVCIAGRNIEKLKQAVKEIGDERTCYLQFDISDISCFVRKLNDAACLLGGYYDAVVNAAGVHSGKNNWCISEELYDEVMDTDLKGAIFLMRKATVLMLNNNIKGNILQIASVAGNKGTINNSPYYMAKNSLINATRYMAKEVAGKGIVINGIAPGVTQTPMSPGNKVREEVQAIGRPIQPEEIANIALFMLSRQPEICIGETIIADGGFWGAW